MTTHLIRKEQIVGAVEAVRELGRKVKVVFEGGAALLLTAAEFAERYELRAQPGPKAEEKPVEQPAVSAKQPANKSNSKGE